MAAVSSSAPQIPQSRQELQERLADLTVAAVQSIAADHFERIAQLDPTKFDLAKAKQALNGGVWYSVEYLQLLKKANGQVTHSEQRLLDLGYAPGTYFKRLGKDSIFWIVKPNVSASDAIDAAIKGPTIVDCGIACNLAYHKALRDLLGKARYDKIFNGRLVLVYPRPDSLDAFIQFVKKTVRADTGKPSIQIRKGNLAMVHNNEQYPLKHPYGLFPGFNVMCIGGKRYVGLGTPKDGLTMDEIRKLLVAEFNKDFNPRMDETVTPEQLKGKLDPCGLTEETLKRNLKIQEKDVRGADLTCIQEFNLDRIEKLLQVPADKLTPEIIYDIYPELPLIDAEIAQYK